MICRPHHITRQSPDIYNSMTICAQFVKFHAEDSVGEIFYRYFSKSQIIDCQLGVTLWTKDVGISQCSPSPLLSVVNSVLTGDLTVHQTAFRLLHHSVFLQGKCGATFSSTYASELLSHQTCLCIWLPEHHARRFTWPVYASGCQNTMQDDSPMQVGYCHIRPVCASGCQNTMIHRFTSTCVHLRATCNVSKKLVVKPQENKKTEAFSHWTETIQTSHSWQAALSLWTFQGS